MLDFLHLGVLLLLHTPACAGVPFAVFGLARCSSLPVALNFVQSSFLPFSRSLACLSTVLSIPNHTHVGTLPPSRSLSCVGPVLLMLDPVHVGMFFTSRSSSQTGPILPAPDLLHLEVPLLPRACAHLRLLMLASSLS